MYVITESHYCKIHGDFFPFIQNAITTQRNVRIGGTQLCAALNHVGGSSALDSHDAGCVRSAVHHASHGYTHHMRSKVPLKRSDDEPKVRCEIICCIK